MFRGRKSERAKAGAKVLQPRFDLRRFLTLKGKKYSS